MTAIGDWWQPGELASAVAFLLREGSFVTGQAWLVDGGWSIIGGVEFGDSRKM
jgi:NAD(P)-dependent dehydrogenase (short-subunit alcohol dehydrogenase family)